MAPRHRPLRERCSNTLRVTTRFTQAFFEEKCDPRPVLDVELEQNHVQKREHDDPFEPPRGRKRTRMQKTSQRAQRSKVARRHCGTGEHFPVQIYKIPSLPPSPDITEIDCIHELVPGMFIGFCNDLETYRSFLETDTFTHIVNIVPSIDALDVGDTSLDYGKVSGTRGLRITTQPLATISLEKSRQPRDSTLMNKDQLLTARDFLSLALPYTLDQPLEVEFRPPYRANVLIVAPRSGGGPTEIMAAAICYLAFTSETAAEKVLRYIEDDEEVPNIWKDVIGGGVDGISFVSLVAMMDE